MVRAILDSDQSLGNQFCKDLNRDAVAIITLQVNQEQQE
jgi:hypothetical protein